MRCHWREVFSLQWLLLNYSAKFLPTIKLNYAYCNQRRLLYQLGHITPYCSIQWPRSFKHIADNSTCQHHCSIAYQVFCSNPHPPDCSICTFYSILKRRCYIQEVFCLLAGAQILHLDSVPWNTAFWMSSCLHMRWLNLSSCDYTGCDFYPL